MIVEFRAYYSHSCGAEGIAILSPDDVSYCTKHTKFGEGYLVHVPVHCQGCGKKIRRYTYVKGVKA
jgi:hypothetical protein